MIIDDMNDDAAMPAADADAEQDGESTETTEESSDQAESSTNNPALIRRGCFIMLAVPKLPTAPKLRRDGLWKTLLDKG